MENDDQIVLRAKRSTNRKPKQTFASWCSNSATAFILRLGLDADVVAWIVACMQCSGAMQGIADKPTLIRQLKLRRSKLRWPDELQFECCLLTAKVLWDAYKNGGQSS